MSRIYRLGNDLIFPDPRLASPSGIVAVGGDLSAERLVLAYSMGIFPWYNEDEPIIWWSPDPRSVVFPNKIAPNRSMRKILKNADYKVTCDTCFADVIRHCALARPETWIVEEMQDAYIYLHELGLAHSFEVWIDDELAGGLYGVSLGQAFFGESMFTLRSNCSKIAFYALRQFCLAHDFEFIDSQVGNFHMESLGALDISREHYLALLTESIHKPIIKGSWSGKVAERVEVS